ncbi:MAG: DUF58 domain-containing protein [Isosphaeraceae bacterium]|nr:DUF58 domain-containing protein [Isosphaeraceae bacterium]
MRDPGESEGDREPPSSFGEWIRRAARGFSESVALRSSIPPPEPSPDPASILRRARRLRFRVPAAALDDLSGAYLGARSGRGLIFSELKPYEPGDDVRHIDWNVTARQDRPYVRRFVEERALTVRIVVDVSVRMRFGPPGLSKADRAAQLAALLATAAARSGDLVGLTLFGERIEAEFAPARGARHVARLLRSLIVHEPDPKPAAFGDLPARLGATTRRGLIVLVSDFRFPRTSASAWAKLARRGRVVAFRIVEPREDALPDVGFVRVRDLETGAIRVVDTGSAALRAEYAAAANDRRLAFRRWCAEASIEGVDVSTADDPLTPLLRIFQREDRRRR